MEIGVRRKDMKKCTGILNLSGFKLNIGYHVIKVLDNNTGPIIKEMDYKSINQNSEDEVLLKMEHDIEMWEKLTEDEWRQGKWTVKEGINRPITYKYWSTLENKQRPLVQLTIPFDMV